MQCKLGDVCHQNMEDNSVRLGLAGYTITVQDLYQLTKIYNFKGLLCRIYRKNITKRNIGYT